MLAGDVAVVLGLDVAALIGLDPAALAHPLDAGAGKPFSTSIVAFGSV